MRPVAEALGVTLPYFDERADRGGFAMTGLDQWAAHADEKLVGREVVRTGKNDPYRGEIGTIIGVVVGRGASGYRLFVNVSNGARRGVGETLLDFHATCQLLKDDDTPEKDNVR